MSEKQVKDQLKTYVLVLFKLSLINNCFYADEKQ